MGLGVQLYGVGHNLTQCRKEAYQILREFGFVELEPCILFTECVQINDPGIMYPKEFLSDAANIRADDLKLHSAHAYSFDFAKDMDSMVRVAKQTGIEAYVIKLPQVCSKENCEAFSREIEPLAVGLAENDIRLWLHNEPKDTLTKVDGKSAFEWVLDRLDGMVLAQADVGNLAAGGEVPESFLLRNAKRIASVHLKDMKRTADGFVEVPLGEGDADIAWCNQFARGAGISRIVDMDGGSAADYRNAARLIAEMDRTRV